MRSFIILERKYREFSANRWVFIGSSRRVKIYARRVCKTPLPSFTILEGKYCAFSVNRWVFIFLFFCNCRWNQQSCFFATVSGTNNRYGTHCHLTNTPPLVCHNSDQPVFCLFFNFRYRCLLLACETHPTLSPIPSMGSKQLSTFCALKLTQLSLSTSGQSWSTSETTMVK